jgi:sulfite reductase alpha subunit-like flavoprotein
MYMHPFEFGNFVSRRFEEFGAERIISDGQLDDIKYNENDEFRHWSLRLFESMTSHRGQENFMKQALLVGRNKILGFQKFDFNLLNPPFELEFVDETLPAECRTKYSDMVPTIVCNNELVSAEPTNKIYSMKLDFTSKTLDFQPGDNIAILPSNDINSVKKLIERLGYEGDRVFSIGGNSVENVDLSCSLGDNKCTLELALLYFYDITHSPTKSMLHFFAMNCSSENDQQILLGFAANYPSFVQLEYTPLDVLEMFPTIQLRNDQAENFYTDPNTDNNKMNNSKYNNSDERNLAVFLGLLKPMSARQYSITNSPIVSPNSVHILYKAVEYITKGGQEKHGLCSSWLRSRELGDTVAISVSRTKFRLPNSTTTPIIMVGAGTGISPYFGFLEHRLALKHQHVHQQHEQQQQQEFGKAVLIHGCRSEADFPYKEKLEAALSEGVLTELWPAYSRIPGVKPIYVQHIIAESPVLWKYLHDEGAVMYSCGDIKIGLCVRAACEELAKLYGGLDELQAKAWLQRLSSSGRLLHDEWGASMTEQA